MGMKFKFSLWPVFDAEGEFTVWKASIQREIANGGAQVVWSREDVNRGVVAQAMQNAIAVIKARAVDMNEKLKLRIEGEFEV